MAVKNTVVTINQETPTPLTLGIVDNDDRYGVSRTVYLTPHSDAGYIYVGGPDVNADNGVLVFTNREIPFQLTDSDVLYGIGEAAANDPSYPATVTVRVMHTGV